jgi:hypothetical protein
LATFLDDASITNSRLMKNNIWINAKIGGEVDFEIQKIQIKEVILYNFH